MRNYNRIQEEGQLTDFEKRLTQRNNRIFELKKPEVTFTQISHIIAGEFPDNAPISTQRVKQIYQLQVEKRGRK